MLNDNSFLIYKFIHTYQHSCGCYIPIDIRVRVFANGPIDRGSIPSRFIPKVEKKTVLDTSLLNTQYYKVRIKGK